jgi:four helix bundle protein
MDTSKLKDLKYRTYDFSIQLIKFIGTSIGANVIEGRSGSSLRDLINFYRIALKSSNETKYWLCLLRDGLELDKIEINQLLKEADEISRIIAKSIITMKNKRKEVKKGDS